MADPMQPNVIDPRDGGYGQVGCLLDILSCLVGAAAAILIEFVGGSPGVRWNSIWTGALAGLLVTYFAMDPLLGALARFKVPRQFAESIYFIASLVLPGAVTVAAALIVAGAS
jgi:hypothetical protein